LFLKAPDHLLFGRDARTNRTLAIIRVSAWALACLIWYSPLHATDGALEISQVCALQSGCFPGDAAGFPVTLPASGKYVLTSDLEHDPGVHGNVTIIDVDFDDITIDLNGFGIRSTSTCEPGACDTGNVQGIGGLSRSRVAVRNGRITGVNNSCILLGEQARVEKLTVSHCSLHGISVGTNSIVENVSVSSTGRNGLTSGIGTIYQGCTFSANGLRGDTIGNFDLISSVTVEPRAVGRNVCEDDLCGDGRPRYYITEEEFRADLALTACDSGFHMASMWELFEPSALHYDVRRGFGAADSGSGAPQLHAWIRTGSPVSDGGVPGDLSCEGWERGDSNASGTLVAFGVDDWISGIIWDSAEALCSNTIPVWCVED